MGYIDVLIPGVVGLLILAFPGMFVRPTGDAATDHARQRKIRIIGIVLLAVAVLYLLIKVGEGP